MKNGISSALTEHSVNILEEWVLGLRALGHCSSNLKRIEPLSWIWRLAGGGGRRTLNFHPWGSEPEWVQSYYYAPGKLSHALHKVQIKLNWSGTNGATVQCDVFHTNLNDSRWFKGGGAIKVDGMFWTWFSFNAKPSFHNQTNQTMIE